MTKIIFHTINTAVTTSAQLNKDRRTRGTVGYKSISNEFIEKNKNKEANIKPSKQCFKSVFNCIFIVFMLDIISAKNVRLTPS